MHGFKSFAEPVSIEFNDGITCIVGPNGSGKSNISDAIRWALGEQSPKTLRGGKMEEVIFAGTASRKSRGMAEVTLVIDNSTGILPIDYSEVAITRRMFRSGEGEYFINNVACRLKDIRELIMDTGIGVDGYSLIGQGRIADIVSNKPESRREIFEEAAGIVMYRSKKADSEKKLFAAASNLERVNDIISEIEGRIGGLSEDSIKAKEYLELRERYKTLEINITLKNIEGIELKNEYINDDIAESENAINEIKDEKAGVDRGVAEAREKADELEKLISETRDRLLLSISDINTLVNRSQLSEEKLSWAGKEEARLTEEISAYGDKLSRGEKNACELEAVKKETDQRMKTLEGALAKKAGEYAEKVNEHAALAEQIDGRKNELFRQHNDISVKNSEIGSLEGLAGTLDRRRQQILREKEGSQLTENDINESLAEAAFEIARVKDILVKLREEKESIRAKYNESVLSEKKIAQELSELSVSIGQLSSRKKTIEEMESNYEGYNGAVKFIMRSNIPGIIGVVAELIKAPRGYEIAVETALGASLQNIICKNDEAAQAAIRTLKDNKAGRLTFLPVDSIKPAAYSEVSFKNEKGFKGLGVDCVSFDPKYKNVMEYLLGRVVVVEKLDDAIRLSKSAAGNFRFVTLDGEIINAAGAITGGAYKNRTANLLERKSEIENLSEQIAKAAQIQEEKTARLSGLRALIESAYSESVIAGEKEKEAEVELLRKENEHRLAQGALSDFNSNISKWEKELESIENERSGAGRMIESIKAAIFGSREKIAEIEGELEKLLKRYDEKKLEAEGLSEEITKARIAVSSCENERDNAEALVLRIRGEVNELKEEKKKREDELARVFAERDSLLSGGTGSLDELKAKETEKAAIESYLEELTEEKAQVMSILTESTEMKESLDEKLSVLQTGKYEMEIRKAKNETQLDNYKDKLWEEFEVSYIQAIEFKKKNFSLSSALKDSRDIKNRIKELGEVNVGAIKEYETVGERYAFLKDQRADILRAMSSLRGIIDDMDKTIKAKFKESFDKIVVNFTDIFAELFGGGHAELRLEDETQPLESGIEIIAQPPGKKLQNINLMSVGEKTMIAIALMFAVLKAKPTPFCILDEVEAALDDANIDRFVEYLKKFSGIQFALVTHQKATMEHADILYGVTMPEHGISKVISLKLGDEFEL